MLRKRTTLNPNGYTTKQLINELIHCYNDPNYFIKNYVLIEHPCNGLIPFDLYPYQESAILDYQCHKRIIQLSSRQTGQTKLLLAYALWVAIFHPEQTIAFATNGMNSSLDCRNILLTMYNNLPHDFHITKIVHRDRSKITLDNFSQILFIQPSYCSVRGYSLTHIICNEFAFVAEQHQQDFWASVMPAVCTGGQIIITSTKGPDDGFFMEIWRNAENFHKIVWPWNIVPGRDDSFAKNQKSIIGLDKWNQEFECGWIRVHEPKLEGYGIGF